MISPSESSSSRRAYEHWLEREKSSICTQTLVAGDRDSERADEIAPRLSLSDCYLGQLFGRRIARDKRARRRAQRSSSSQMVKWPDCQVGWPAVVTAAAFDRLPLFAVVSVLSERWPGELAPGNNSFSLHHGHDGDFPPPEHRRDFPLALTTILLGRADGPTQCGASCATRPPQLGNGNNDTDNNHGNSNHHAECAKR